MAIPGNLLSYNTESAETDASSWGPVAATLAQSAAQALDGTHSVQLTATGNAAVGMIPFPAGYAAVTAGVTCTCFAWVFTASAGLTAFIEVDWYNGAAFVSSSFSGNIALAANGWTQVSFTAAAPAGATAGRLIPVVNTTTAGQSAFLDEMFLGVPPPPPGVLTASTSSLATLTAADAAGIAVVVFLGLLDETAAAQVTDEAGSPILDESGG